MCLSAQHPFLLVTLLSGTTLWKFDIVLRKLFIMVSFSALPPLGDGHVTLTDQSEDSLQTVCIEKAHDSGQLEASLKFVIWILCRERAPFLLDFEPGGCKIIAARDPFLPPCEERLPEKITTGHLNENNRAPRTLLIPPCSAPDLAAKGQVLLLS